MAWQLNVNTGNSDGKATKTPQGPFLFPSGAFAVMYGPGPTLVSSTTETSLLTGATGTTITQPSSGVLTNLGLPQNGPYPASSLILPGNIQGGMGMGSLALGTLFYFNFLGTIANTGTPNFTLKLGLVHQGTGTFTAIATIPATAMVTTTAVLLEIQGSFIVVTGGSSGEIDGQIEMDYLPSSAATNVVSLNSPYGALSSFDLTQTYALDIRATWGTSSASNTTTVKYGVFELVG